MAKTAPRRVTPNYQDLGKLALRDEIKKLLDHKDPTIRLLAVFALRTDG